METDDRSLQDIYFRFMRGELPIEEAARQITEYTLKQKVETGALDFNSRSDDEHAKLVELLDYLLQPIQQKYFRKELSPKEAAAQMAPILLPHGSWGLMFDSEGLSDSEQEELNEMLNILILAIAELEGEPTETKSS